VTGPAAGLSASHDDRHLSAESAERTLIRACQAAGLDPAGARLLRLGEHAMFRLVAPVVVRIARTTAYERDARKEVAVARWLESLDYPAVRALHLEQPLTVDGRVVTFWGAVSDDENAYGNTAELAALLARLHGLTPTPELGLAQLRPFDRSGRRIAVAEWLRPPERAFLGHLETELLARYEQLSFELPAGLIHGDANVGNVIRDYAGGPVLIDLDGFCIGPREWDLVLTAMYYDSFGWHTEAEYADFTRVYGFDVMRWPGYPVLRDIREFLMVTWLSQKGADDQVAADEVRKRIASLRSGGSRKDWVPY
jgi:aminoglycoside phosphotransferase (APT) family kinase protein